MFFIIGFVLVLCSCSDNKHLVNVGSIDVSPNLVRFEQDLFACKNVQDIKRFTATAPHFLFHLHNQHYAWANWYRYQH
jgi:hypothetical protein